MIEEIKDLLNRIEWIDEVTPWGMLRFCPDCGAYEENGHDDPCQLKRIVDKLNIKHLGRGGKSWINKSEAGEHETNI
jgi:hypothetical protein